MTPSSDSMVALYKTVLRSAMDVASMRKSHFLKKHGGSFPNQTEAEMVYKKSQEIHTTALNVATMYLSYRGAPNVYSISGSVDKQEPTWPSNTPGGPTLEDLLKNMDYCACDECK